MTWQIIIKSQNSGYWTLHTWLCAFDIKYSLVLALCSLLAFEKTIDMTGSKEMDAR